MTRAVPRQPVAPVTVTIRRATIQDIAEVVRLRSALRREERGLAGPGLVPDDAGGAVHEQTRRQLADESQCWLLATTPGAMCGVLRCAIQKRVGMPAHAVLTTAYVEPAHRRRGVLHALVAAASAWADDRGVRDLRVRTNSANTQASAAWEALGFVPAQVVRRRVLP